MESLFLFVFFIKNHLDVVLYIHTITSDWRQSSKSNWATKFETTPIYFYDMTTERDTFHYYYSPRKHKKGGGLIVSFSCIFYCASSVRFAGTAEVAIRMSGILSNFDFFPFFTNENKIVPLYLFLHGAEKLKLNIYLHF